MVIINVLLYFLLLVIGASTITVVSGLTKNYKFPFLSIYFYYIISFNAIGFMFFILNRFSEGIYWKSILILFPMIIFTFYLFISFILSIVEKKLSSTVTIMFFSVSTILFIGFGLLYNRFYLDNKLNENFLLLYFYFLIFIMIIIVSYLLVYILFSNSIRDIDKKKILAAKEITIIYSIAIIIALMSFLLERDPFLLVIQIVFLFLVNIYPLLYIRNFLNMHYIDHFLINEKKINFAKFYEKYKISEREQEIVRFLIQGKSNKDIEDNLFISLKTVKNHIYNIYKKTSVSSRIQLVNLVTKFKK